MEPAKSRTGSSLVVTADRWSRKEIRDVLLRLKDVMFDKNMEEHRLLKGMKMASEGGSEADLDDQHVFSSRQRWISKWLGRCGSLESVTEIISMPFTNHPAPPCAYPCNTLLIYEIVVCDIIPGLEWPLDVFGMVAVRDNADHNLNIVYYRTRDNCQTLTSQDPYLTLTGPSRAIVLDSENSQDVVIEVELKVKGTDEFEDEYLSFLAQPFAFSAWREGPVYLKKTSKLCTLLFRASNIAASVEATIFIRVMEGSWPVGVSGQLTARVQDEPIVLLTFGAGAVPVGGDGHVKLSRRVVSVPINSGLDVCYTESMGGTVAHFEAAKAGRSYGTLELVTCKLEVLVAWSVVSPDLDGTSLWC